MQQAYDCSLNRSFSVYFYRLADFKKEDYKEKS